MDLSKFHFGMFATVDIGGAHCFITRTGYTGEDGFEISVPNEKALHLTERLCANESVKLCGALLQGLHPLNRTLLTIALFPCTGLGARDSLRLEAGLCLYGNDLDETITPIEAGLAWTVGASSLCIFTLLGG